ncbi:SRPBCC domain-containing protein [Streptomyces sp. XM4193]|uniref:SRPBCC domain-containing protein n=1 Tax=Streptomyces sp. XM4193 TaxID=2929782 RepID=UPI001FF72B4A|nr:SRPBCC domain-containing protein [Streptomyces sp. XM4193]MCK1794797.1 SRPBCC domain-containing protein [Streptomyces sp. XM4193]
MKRTDRAQKWVPADSGRVYAALVDADALAQWLPPEGMHGRFEHFDPRPGGSFRMVLTYLGDDEGNAKSGEGQDVVESRFVELVPGRRVVQAIDFVSDDPAYSGTMTMTWELTPGDGGTLMEIRAEDVPSGISAEDHAAGLSSSLSHLAAHLAQDTQPDE